MRKYLLEKISFLLKTYIENQLHIIRHNKNRNLFYDFIDQNILNDKFYTDINDLNYQMWVNSLDMKQKDIEKDIKEFYFNLLTLKNKNPFNEIEKDCKDITNFIYFMELLINNINNEFYDVAKHKIMQKITVLCLFVFFIFYMIHFERKIKKKMINISLKMVWI